MNHFGVIGETYEGLVQKEGLLSGLGHTETFDWRGCVVEDTKHPRTLQTGIFWFYVAYGTSRYLAAELYEFSCGVFAFWNSDSRR